MLIIFSLVACSSQSRSQESNSPVTNTGLSKGFFYKNEQVRDVLNEEREKQDQSKLAQIKREVRDKSLEKQVELYQKKLKRLIYHPILHT